MTNWYDATVQRIEQAAANVRRYWIQVESESQFEFKAGQFVTFDLPIGEKRAARWRSYSIASAPDQTNTLEFCIVRSAEGAGTRYFFEEVKIGTKLRFKGADGTFYLPEIVDKDLVFICTGTGIAPFRSMIIDTFEQKKVHQNIHLIFGTRTKKDILYEEEMTVWQQKIPNFTFEITLSREKTPPYFHGHVHSLYLEKYAAPRADLAFYLCGWQNMVDEAVENLTTKMGYRPDQVKFELYG